MTGIDKDILQTPGLKANPYGLPEGYMESLKEKAMKYPQPVRVPARERRRVLTYIISIAASFLLVITAGALLSIWSSVEEGMTQEDYIVFSDGYSILEIYDTLEDGQYADASINEEDIIEYLIYSGVNENIIEQSK